MERHTKVYLGLGLALLGLFVFQLREASRLNDLRAQLLTRADATDAAHGVLHPAADLRGEHIDWVESGGVLRPVLLGDHTKGCDEMLRQWRRANRTAIAGLPSAEALLQDLDERAESAWADCTVLAAPDVPDAQSSRGEL